MTGMQNMPDKKLWESLMASLISTFLHAIINGVNVRWLYAKAG
jgi:hypothetical protein